MLVALLKLPDQAALPPPFGGLLENIADRFGPSVQNETSPLIVSINPGGAALVKLLAGRNSLFPLAVP
jgi:hypothetical protein